ncbi:MAG: OmpA family protein [Bacteroidia bacterium]
MRKYLHYLTPIIFTIALISCKASREEADKAYKQSEYAVAAEMYKRLYSNKEYNREDKQEVAFLTAESYRRADEYRQAEIQYKKAIRIGYPDPIAHYYHGRMLKQLEKYEDAIVSFQNYKKAAPSDTLADFEIRACELALKWIEEGSRYEVENFRFANSSDNDFAPMYYKSDRTIYFSSDRPESQGNKTYGWTGMGYSDIYSMDKARSRRFDRWANPAALTGDVNTNFNEGTPAFNERGSVMYYTQCNGANGKDSTCRIYEARKRGKDWNVEGPLPFCADSNLLDRYGQPFLSADESKLFFASNREGGLGGHDIWVSFYVKRGRTWSDPVNLGPTINTPGDEFFPYHREDTVLYFSSDYHLGMGGLDIFRSYGTGTDWTEPENLRSPLNSGGDDFGITINESGNEGFFTSNRPRSRGDDIYSFILNPLIFTLSGQVKDLKTEEVIPNAIVTLISSTSDEPQYDTTDESGSYEFTLDAESDYQVMAKKQQYFNSKEEFQTTVGLRVSTDLYQDLYLDPYITVITISGIFYDLDKAFIRPDAASVLDSVVDLLSRNPYLVVEMGSHTDCRNTMAYNEDLSRRRADSAVDYLVRNGIDRQRLFAKGYGETQLANECACEDGAGAGLGCTEAEHQANRRTTFRILATDYNPETKNSETVNKMVESGELEDPNLGSEEDIINAEKKRLEEEKKRLLEEQENPEGPAPEGASPGEPSPEKENKPGGSSRYPE